MVLLDEVSLEVLAESSKPGFNELRIVNASHGEPDYDKLLQTIVSDDRMRNARVLQISDHSRIDRLNFIALMPKLDWLDISARRISDCSPIVKKGPWRNVGLSLGVAISIDLKSITGLSTDGFGVECPTKQQCQDWPKISSKSLGIYGWHLEDFKSLENPDLSFISFQAAKFRKVTWTCERPLRGLNLVACPRLEQFCAMPLDALSLYQCPKLDLSSIRNIMGLRRLELHGKDMDSTLRRVPAIDTLETLELHVRHLPRVLPELERYRFLKTVVVNNALDYMLDAYQTAWPDIQFSNRSKESIFANI